jgi:hypothetical protein
MAIDQERKKLPKLTPAQIEAERLKAERIWRAKRRRAEKRKKEAKGTNGRRA